MRSRPHNLLGPDLIQALTDALAWVPTTGARAAILRSGLRHFCAGADLDWMLTATRDTAELPVPTTDLLRAFDELPMPIVAAVHGICLGGGPELALACDLIVAAETMRTDCSEHRVARRDVPDRSGGTITVPGRPWHFSGSKAEPVDEPDRIPAFQGEHNVRILREVGYPDDQIAELTVRGALIAAERVSPEGA